MNQLTYHFDYLSPYAYLAWTWVRELCADRDLELVAEPTLLGVLLAHHKHLGPAEIPPKREFVFRDVLRVARHMGVPIAQPRVHPFNSIHALRVSLREVAGADQLAVIDALWQATWVTGADLASAEDVAQVLDAAGFDGAALVERSQTPEAKLMLRDRMTTAIQRGVFGVPTFFVGEELFWGNDQRRWIEACLDGDRGYDEAQLQRFLATPFGVRRKP